MQILYRFLIVALLAAAPVLVLVRYEDFSRGELGLFEYAAMCLSPIVAATILVLISRKVLRDKEAFSDA